MKAVFDRLGGVGAVCDYVKASGQDLRVETARMWIHRKQVPWRWRFVLLSMAAAQGVKDEVADLFPESVIGDAA